jgi:hypothetical protein
MKIENGYKEATETAGGENLTSEEREEITTEMEKEFK